MYSNSHLLPQSLLSINSLAASATPQKPLHFPLHNKAFPPPWPTCFKLSDTGSQSKLSARESQAQDEPTVMTSSGVFLLATADIVQLFSQAESCWKWTDLRICKMKRVPCPLSCSMRQESAHLWRLDIISLSCTSSQSLCTGSDMFHTVFEFSRCAVKFISSISEHALTPKYVHVTYSISNTPESRSRTDWYKGLHTEIPLVRQ